MNGCLYVVGKGVDNFAQLFDGGVQGKEGGCRNELMHAAVVARFVWSLFFKELRLNCSHDRADPGDRGSDGADPVCGRSHVPLFKCGKRG